MIAVRSIGEGETAWFARLGGGDVERAIRAAWKDGSSRPDWTLVAEADGRPLARGMLATEPIGCGLEALEGTAAFLWADHGAPGVDHAFSLLVEALVERLRPNAPTTLDRRLNPEIHGDVDAMRDLLERTGFDVLQEKVGLAWSSDVPRPSPPANRVATLADVGRTRFLEVMASTTAGTLDRNDRYYIGRCGPDAWAREIMGALAPGDETSWLLVDHGGEPAGFVAVGSFDEETWTIVHVGVVPGHRGHGHVHELLAAADDVARRRGFAAGLSDVDTENGPMLRAMERAGHRSDLRPWHVWHYRRAVT